MGGKKGQSKYTLDDVKNEASKKGLILLSTEYVNTSKKLSLQCPKHGIFEMDFSCLLSQSGCRKCGRGKQGQYRKLAFDFVKKEIEKKGYELLSTKYEGANKKMELKCSKHGVFKTSYSIIKQGHGCKKCGREQAIKKTRYSVEDANAIIKSMGYEGSYPENITVEDKFFITCPKHGQIETYLTSLRCGHGCYYCGVEKTHAKLRTPIEEVNQIVESFGYKLKSEYRERHLMIDLECPRHGIFKTRFGDIKKGVGCPACSSLKTEKECREIFNKFLNKHFIPVSYKDFILSQSKRPLKLDGFCKELKLAFEYDGKQHYEQAWYQTKDVFDRANYRDLCKNLLCQQHGIYLIRIPYFVKEIESFIQEEINIWKVSISGCNE